MKPTNDELAQLPDEVRKELLEMEMVYEPAIEAMPESFWETRFAEQHLEKYGQNPVSEEAGGER